MQVQDFEAGGVSDEQVCRAAERAFQQIKAAQLICRHVGPLNGATDNVIAAIAQVIALNSLAERPLPGSRPAPPAPSPA